MNRANLLIRKLLPIMSTKRSLFVQNARSLEKLKTGEIPEEIYRSGSYVVFLKDKDAVLLDPSTKTLVWKGIELFNGIPNAESAPLRILLDVVGQAPESCLFAVDLPTEDSIEEAGQKLGGKFFESRRALFILHDKEASLVSQARGLINFCHTTNFCKNCGGKLKANSAGTQKSCAACKKVQYPTLSPVGIVLIDDASHQKVLLVRGPRHPRGMFSCVAGFIEPGESLEDNIRREIAEEVGLDVRDVQYCSSQHWAMPESQLMLGCLATATTVDFQVDPVELEGALWVDAETLADALSRAKNSKAVPNLAMLWVPPPSAVAHSLMELWLKKYHPNLVPVNSHI